MSATDVPLNQPVIATGEARTFFFNGRLLSAEDLKREQGQRETGQRWLAQLIGCGIAKGLGVTGEVGKTTLSIAAGLGVTPAGELVAVGDLTLDLRAAASRRIGGDFDACAAAFDSGSLLAGLHLLVLTPTWIGDGRARTLLGDVGACNRNVELPAVRARLVKLKEPTSDPGEEPSAVQQKRRNRLAYALLGPDPLSADFATTGLIGWLPNTMAPTLRGDDLPIAVVGIDEQAQIVFLDVHAAQRRLAPSPGTAADGLWPASRTVAMEAFALQFLDQLSKIDLAKVSVKDADAFVWLPPVAVLDGEDVRQRFERVFADSFQVYPYPVNRAEFARMLHTGLSDEPTELSKWRSGYVYLAELIGGNRWLLSHGWGGAWVA